MVFKFWYIFVPRYESGAGGASALSLRSSGVVVGARQIKMEPVSGLRPTAAFPFPFRSSRAWLRSNEKPAYLFGKRVPFCSVELAGLEPASKQVTDMLSTRLVAFDF